MLSRYALQGWLICGRAPQRRPFFFLLTACAEDREQLKAQTDEAAKAIAQAAAQVAQQDDARCQSYGRPGSAAYIDCRTSLKNDRAAMQK